AKSLTCGFYGQEKTTMRHIFHSVNTHGASFLLLKNNDLWIFIRWHENCMSRAEDKNRNPQV
ncbi:MAG: hypothetical protein KAR62_08335, partial [Sphingomonadales bacterium]|nr:hypothetical protein [Sphingomonadales bacterium]